MGQGHFKRAVADAYGNRCAVTTSATFPSLEAAHIRPFAEGGEHAVSNGLLLRTDVHRLYDRGYLSVDADLRLRVSPSCAAMDGTARSSTNERRQATGSQRRTTPTIGQTATHWPGTSRPSFALHDQIRDCDLTGAVASSRRKAAPWYRADRGMNTHAKTRTQRAGTGSDHGCHSRLISP